jgi:hypothetical protein
MNMNREKEIDLLRKALPGKVWVRFGKNEIQVFGVNGVESETVFVPSRLVGKVRDFLNNPRVCGVEDRIEIRRYVKRVVSAGVDMEFRGSTPKERELKFAVVEEMLQGFFEDMEKLVEGMKKKG